MKFISQHYITGRGIVLAYKYNKDDKRLEAGDILTHYEKKYEIRSIEQFWKLCDPPILSSNVGFLVRELK